MAASPHVYIVDTNALLNDPEVVYSFSGSEVVVPAVVLKELDKLKRRGNDRRIRYHGRKATRLLFEASQNGRLIDGVSLGNGSILRVDPFDDFTDLPSDLNLDRVDDVILAHAYTVNQRPGVHATLVTNDLNMLLRAEALGVSAYRFEGKLDQLHRQEKSLMTRAREARWTLVLGLLAAVFFASTVYLWADRPQQDALAELPIEPDANMLQLLGVTPDVLEQHYQERILADPGDADARVQLGNLLFDQRRFLEAIDAYREALSLEPENADVRVDMGIALRETGNYAEAITAFQQAVTYNPRHGLAYFHLGVAYSYLGDTARSVQALNSALALAQAGDDRVPVEETLQLIAQLEGEGTVEAN